MTANEMLFKDIAQALASTNKKLSLSKLFGKPAVKSGDKAFLCFFQDEMVFKLNGKSLEDAKKMPGSKLFDPSGKNRPMHDWVQVPGMHKGNWARLAGIAHGLISGVLKSEPVAAKKPTVKKAAAAPVKTTAKKKKAAPASKKSPAKKKTAPAKAVKKAAPKKTTKRTPQKSARKKK